MEDSESTSRDKILMVVLAGILLIFGGLAWFLHDTSTKKMAETNTNKTTDLVNATKNSLNNGLKDIQADLIKTTDKLSALINESLVAINNISDLTYGNSVTLFEVNSTLNAAQKNLTAQNEQLKNLVIKTNDNVLMNAQIIGKAKSEILKETDNILAALAACSSKIDGVDARLADYYNQFVEFSKVADQYITAKFAGLADLLAQYRQEFIAYSQVANNYFDAKFAGVTGLLAQYRSDFEAYSAEAKQYIDDKFSSVVAGANGIYNSLLDARTELASVGLGVQNANDVVVGNNAMLSDAMPLITGNNQMLSDAMPLITANNQMLSDIQNAKFNALNARLDALEAKLDAICVAVSAGC